MTATDTAALTPQDCPKFYTCSAAICPLDPRWPSAVHLNGERVCAYLLATGKVGSEERFKDDPIMSAVRIALPLVTAKHPIIASAVEKASRYGYPGDGRTPPRRAKALSPTI